MPDNTPDLRDEGRLARLDQQIAAVRDLYRRLGNDGWGREDLITLVYSTRILLGMLDGVPAELRRLRERVAALEAVADLAYASRQSHIRPGDTDHADSVLGRLDEALAALEYVTHERPGVPQGRGGP